MPKLNLTEELFAEHLRGARIPFHREYRFDSQRRWRSDFLIPPNLLIEIEGAVWQAGRHTRGSGFVADLEKYNRMTELGYRLLRFTTEMVQDGTALAVTERVARGDEAAHA